MFSMYRPKTTMHQYPPQHPTNRQRGQLGRGPARAARGAEGRYRRQDHPVSKSTCKYICTYFVLFCFNVCKHINNVYLYTYTHTHTHTHTHIYIHAQHRYEVERDHYNADGEELRRLLAVRGIMYDRLKRSSDAHNYALNEVYIYI